MSVPPYEQEHPLPAVPPRERVAASGGGKQRLLVAGKLLLVLLVVKMIFDTRALPLLWRTALVLALVVGAVVRAQREEVEGGDATEVADHYQSSALSIVFVIVKGAAKAFGALTAGLLAIGLGLLSGGSSGGGSSSAPAATPPASAGGSAEPKLCRRCDGEGFYICATCDGTGLRVNDVCPECHGAKRAKCRPCMGTGYTH